jgi:fibronectin-binding autotransporter adhesin
MALATVGLALACVSPGLAAVTTNGSIYDDGYDYYVAYTAGGTLSIDGASVLSRTYGYIGYNSGCTGTATVTGTGSIWTNRYDLYIGNSGSGTLNIEAGGLVSNKAGSLGIYPGSSGTVTVTGTGSTWTTNSNALYVGASGSGTLNIEAGGLVSTSTGYLGCNSGSIGTGTGTGTVTVTGTDSTWASTGDLYVGHNGSGTLTVENGGLVTTKTLYASLIDLFGNGTIAANGAILDTALVFDGTHGFSQAIPFGTGGVLNLNVDQTSTLGAGHKKTGTLRIADGITVASTTGILGNCSGATGTATVTGTGSTWTNSRDLLIGNSGSGTLSIESGALVSSSTGTLGNNTGSTGTATVTGTGSTWTNTATLYVGNFGSGTLSIKSGALVSSYTAYLGYNSGSTGTATVTGTGSMWTNSNYLYIGNYGGGTLNIEAGAQVSDYYGYIGYHSRSTGTVTVTGTGSTWTNTFQFYVGRSGSGTLNIEAGGLVSNANGYIGSIYGSTGTVTVTGTGSTWTNTFTLLIGESGSGTLNIKAGALVSNKSGYIGNNSISTGTVTVTGTGSTWTNANNLYVGYYGSGSLTVENGGLVSAQTLYASLSDLYGNGTIAASGAILDTALVFDATHGLSQAIPFGTGGALNLNLDETSTLGAGYKGIGTLRIADAITVASSTGIIGDHVGSTGTVTVTGTGSTWNSMYLNVGTSGRGALNIEAGGLVGSSQCTLGNDSGSTGAVKVTGTGSTWTNTGGLSVGNNGSGSLTVENGGSVTALTLFAALNDLHGNGTITAKGAILDAALVFDATHSLADSIAFGTGGSLNLNLDGTSTLGVGYKGIGTLRIADAITVASFIGTIGNRTGSTGTATVTGTGSTWTSTGNLYVGNSGSGTLNIKNGGQVSNATSYLGYNIGSSGTATVTGTGSTWTNSRYIYVGRSGGGTLNIEAGALVSNSTAYIGNDSGSTGTVTVTGTGSKWTNTSTLYVGVSSSGTLNIESGGQVSSNYNGYLGYNSGSTGTVTVTGIGSTWTNTYSLYVGNRGQGTVTQNDGIISVGQTLYLGQDYGSKGAYYLNGGVLAIRALAKGTGTAHFYFGGGTLRADASFATNMPLELTGSGGDAHIDTAGNNVSLTGTLSGSGGLQKLGTGSLEIVAAPKYLGNTSVTEGTLKYNIGAAGGTPSIGDSTTLTIAGAGSSVVVTGNTDPFTDGANPGLHASIVNDSTLELQRPVAVNAISGAGKTIVSAGASLTAATAAQGIVANSGSFTITSGTTNSIGTITGTGDTCTGTTIIAAGTTLTANHIRQDALILAGTETSPAILILGGVGDWGSAATGDGFPAGQPAAAADAILASSNDNATAAGAIGSDSNPVPEPGALALLAAAVFGIGAWRGWRRGARL